MNKLFIKFSKYDNKNVNSKETADAAFCQIGSYKFGQYKDIKTNNFSLEKAVAICGFKELSENNKLWEEGESWYGISDVQKKKFAISSKIKMWKFTVLHELGHLFLKQEAINYIEVLFFNKDLTYDLEADLFAYFCLTSLGLEKEAKDPVMGIRFKNVLNLDKNWKGLPSNERVKEIEAKAEEFIALGEIN